MDVERLCIKFYIYRIKCWMWQFKFVNVDKHPLKNETWYEVMHEDLASTHFNLLVLVLSDECKLIEGWSYSAEWN